MDPHAHIFSLMSVSQLKAQLRLERAREIAEEKQDGRDGHRRLQSMIRYELRKKGQNDGTSCRWTKN